MKVATLAWLVAWSAMAAKKAPDATAEAKAHFNKGTAFYSQARYEDAIAELEAAYRAKPHGVINYNLAQCYEKLGDISKALAKYQDYLREVPDAKDRATVESVIANLQRRLDEQQRAQQAQVTPEPPAKPAIPTPAVQQPPPQLIQPAPEPPRERKRTWTWVATAASGMALAAAGGMGMWARRDSDALRADVHEQVRAQELHDGALRKSQAANVLYGVAGAAAVAGVTLFIVEGRF